MMSRVEHALRRLRSAVSRSAWLGKLLRLPVCADNPDEPGLLLIQIDGLSEPELRKALDRGEMRFLRRLKDREHFKLRSVYAGVPATTSAVQAELLYGVRQAVPAFAFLDHESGELVRMIEPSAAARVEQQAQDESASPLLRGGSCYANNFTGGAAEPHFCPSSRGWGRALREASIFTVIFLVIVNLPRLARAAVLAIAEIFIAIIDVIRGTVDGRDFVQELKFIPSRVAITILLRELSVIGAKIDLARGLPIVHINMLGYDEQSHRRGPTSRFAHAALKGIDSAIKRVWKASNRSTRRTYELIVYSDHGQESAVPYQREHGRTFAEAIADVFASQFGKEVPYLTTGTWGAELHRAGNMGDRLARQISRWIDGVEETDDNPRLQISAQGPVALIYWDEELSYPRRAELARRMVTDANVPLVLVHDQTRGVVGWTTDGEYRLPEESRRLLGDNHPYWKQAGEDLAKLCAHRNAGTFLACGTVAYGNKPITFANENGSHGGAGAVETSAFALLPPDARLDARYGEHPRILDLRETALRMRGKPTPRVIAAHDGRTVSSTLRIMTYNVHGCRGMDGRTDPHRIARVIARCEPDIVCLQEVDVNRARSGAVDQAHRIAEILGMEFHFHPSLRVEEERYGNAILSTLPLRRVRAGALPSWNKRRELEPRGALWVEVHTPSGAVQIVNTHLGLRARERRRQVEALLGEDWIGHQRCTTPRVLCGDFNLLPGSRSYKRIVSNLSDAQRILEGHRPRPTFSGRIPSARLDHVFIDDNLQVTSVEVPKTELCRVASDHLPLLVEVRVPAPEDLPEVKTKRSPSEESEFS